MSSPPTTKPVARPSEKGDASVQKPVAEKKAVERDDRIPFNTSLRFESDDGCHIIKGTTSDVSMSGAFLSSNALPPGIPEGLEGVVFLEMTKEGNTFEVSFHCVVARVTPRGLGLNFESEVE